MEALICDFCGGVIDGVPIDDSMASRLDVEVEREIEGELKKHPYSVKIHVRPATGLHICPTCANKGIVDACKTFKNRNPVKLYRKPKK